MRSRTRRGKGTCDDAASIRLATGWDGARVIHEIDEALIGLLRARAALGKGVEVAFEAPTRDWAAGRNAPTINAYLYNIREDTARHEYGMISVRDESGIVVQRRRPTRYFRLSYLVTCWTKRAVDEHRLLSSVLGCLLDTEVLPMTGSGALAALGLPVPLTVAVPPENAGSASDIWSALGGTLKPSLDVVVTAPYPAASGSPVAPPVTEAAGVTGRRLDAPGTADPVRLRRVKR